MKKELFSRKKTVLALSELNKRLGSFLTKYGVSLSIQEQKYFADLQATLCLEILLLTNYPQKQFYISTLSWFVRCIEISATAFGTKETGYLLNRENLNIYEAAQTIVNSYYSILEAHERECKNKTRYHSEQKRKL